jgi:YHS domain-containing protein
MQRNMSVMLFLAGALGLAGLSLASDTPNGSLTIAPPSTQPTTQPVRAVDLGNTICPVSGDKVDNSKLVEVYGGKVYHMCCADCNKDFEKDPAKFAQAVAANPAKYGVK